MFKVEKRDFNHNEKLSLKLFINLMCILCKMLLQASFKNVLEKLKYNFFYFNLESYAIFLYVLRNYFHIFNELLIKM